MPDFLEQQASEFLTICVENGVRRIELTQPPAHALSRRMIAALLQAFEDAQSDVATQVITLIGPGRIFCAGHDMKEIRAHRNDADDGLAYLTDLFAACAKLMQTISLSSKPTIAVTEGVATAGGLQLLASCDIVFAAPGASFALPGVVNGGFCTTPSVAVSRRIGRSATLEMSYSGEAFDTDWALRTGLINRIVPKEDVRAQAMNFAKNLAARHMPAVFAGKNALRAHADTSLQEAYAIATPVMLEHFMDPHRIAKDKDRW